MILIFFFSLFWIYLVKTLVNFLFFKKKFKIMALINYTVWWILSLYGEYNRIFYNDLAPYNFIIPFSIYSLPIFYIYELFFHKPDLAHFIHHLLTIIIQIYMFKMDFFSDEIHIIIGISAYFSHISSSFSALRNILYETKYKNISANIYRISYLTFKSFSIIYYYYIFINYFSFLMYDTYKLIFFIYSLIHLNQIYFMYIIICNYIKKLKHLKI